MSVQDPPDFEELGERYLDEAPEAPQGLEFTEVFAYVHYKAFVYLAVGPDQYRRFDALQLPLATWPAVVYDAIQTGCEQILRWNGLSAERPLEGVGIAGFYRLMRMFHFRVTSRVRFDGGPNYIIDMMNLTHLIDRRELAVFNRVATRSLEKRPGPPCPYCGAPLRTVRSKQCRVCKADWHAHTASRKLM